MLYLTMYERKIVLYRIWGDVLGVYIVTLNHLQLAGSWQYISLYEE